MNRVRSGQANSLTAGDPVALTATPTFANVGTMLKFVVVLYRRPDLSPEAFFANLRDEHGPLAERIPGLRRYVQNHVLPDPRREHPGWDAVIELYWDDWASMEAAWATPEGQAATNHLQTLADLSRTTWSVVQEHVRR